MGLGRRLEQLHVMVGPEFDHVWDCCCDHGYLGASLLAKKPEFTVHFLDIVPKLMESLEEKLHLYHPMDGSTSARWQTHCLDVVEIPLQKYTGKHLVILAGVGGDLVADFVRAITRKHPGLEIDFLLCPVYRQFTLRRTLIELGMVLKGEVLVEENKRFSEIIHISTSRNGAVECGEISPVGVDIWRSNTERQKKIVQAYLDQTLTHYRRALQGKDAEEAQIIIDAYQKISL